MTSGPIIETLAGIAPGSALAAALAGRAEIMALSQAAHDAVLLPRDPGGLSRGERAAFAARMARHNGQAALATHYSDLLGRTDEAKALAPFCASSQIPDDARLAALIRHIDLLTCEPRGATRGSIDALRTAGIAEPDIVRLSELAAFVNYQVRVIVGLALIGEAA